MKINSVTGTGLMTEYIMVFTTVESRGDAEKIAGTLVEKRLAACAQIVGPITSYFQWQGKLESAEEFLCLLKSRKDLFAELESTVKNIHPYDVPEILAVPISTGNVSYLGWLEEELETAQAQWGKDI
jgi:periplasmic divalent cation tolerance protein